MEIKNYCSEIPFKKKKNQQKNFNWQQMDYGFDIYIFRGVQLQ